MNKTPTLFNYIMKKLIYLLFFILLISCEESEIRFEKPIGNRIIREFKQKDLGFYVSKEDSNFIIEVKKNFIVQKRISNETIAQSTIDSSTFFSVKNDYLIDSLNNHYKIIRHELDSVIIENIWTDTIFSFSRNELLKKGQNRYYLNYKSNEEWLVRTLEIKNNQLQIGKLKVDSLQAIKEYTEVKTDTIDDKGTHKHYISPTKRELKKLLKENVFEQQGIFEKVD